MNLPPYATDQDLKRCINIIEDYIEELTLSLSKDQTQAITIDIMNISYSHGGDYSDEIIHKYTESYFDSNLHLKSIPKNSEHS
jgi:hypothetical protein